MGHHTVTRSLIIDKVAHNDPTYRASGIFREGRQIRPVFPRDNYQFGLFPKCESSNNKKSLRIKRINKMK